MTPAEFQVLIARTGRSHRDLARMLGYGSKTTITRLVAGAQSLPDEQIRWLQAYADRREKARETEAAWLLKYPVPQRPKKATLSC